MTCVERPQYSEVQEVEVEAEEQEKQEEQDRRVYCVEMITMPTIAVNKVAFSFYMILLKISYV